MNKKVIVWSSVALVIIIVLVLISLNPSQVNSETKNKINTSENSSSNTVKKSASKVQVFLFHATKRCTTCIAIGRLAGETVNEYFQAELKNGQIEFREVNIDLPENKALANKFQASGSALFINAITDNQDIIQEDTQVWSLTQNPDEFKNYLKNKINNLFGK